MGVGNVLEEVLAKKDQMVNTKMVILRNDMSDYIKYFPETIRKSVCEEYFVNLKELVRGASYTSLLTGKEATGIIPYIDVDKLPIWNIIITRIDQLSVINQDNEIREEDYNKSGNIIVTEITFDDDTSVFFLTRYQKVSSWYSNALRFRRKNDGKFHQEKGKIMALTPFVDAVIIENICYCINYKNFEKIFKFDKIVDDEIEAHKDDLKNMKFIDNTQDFIDKLLKGKRYKRNIAKVIHQGKLEKIAKYSAKEIRQKINSRKELDFIEFSEQDEIIINNKSFKAVIDILTGDINIDLFTDELNGVDQYDEGEASATNKESTSN